MRIATASAGNENAVRKPHGERQTVSWTHWEGPAAPGGHVWERWS